MQNESSLNRLREYYYYMIGSLRRSYRNESRFRAKEQKGNSLSGPRSTLTATRPMGPLLSDGSAQLSGAGDL